jgi:hypothetical protein
MATKRKYFERCCAKCGDLIPPERRSDAIYCSQSCRAAAEKKRYKDKHPEYVQKQLALVRKIRHLKEYGHTEFIDNPQHNKKDRFGLARSLGFRSMLEYTVAKQLQSLNVEYEYEKHSIEYIRPNMKKKEYGEFLTWLENNDQNALLELSWAFAAD